MSEDTGVSVKDKHEALARQLDELRDLLWAIRTTYAEVIGDRLP